MMGQQCRSESLFYYFRIEDHVPESHLLRLIDKYVSFGELKNRICLRRARLRRLKHVREQFLMAATAQNLKRLVRHLAKVSPTAEIRQSPDPKP